MRSVSARLAAIAISMSWAATALAQGDPVARAEQLIQAGKPEEALKVYSEAIRKDPTYAPFHVSRGLINVSMKKWRDALNDCSAGLQLQRPTADVHYCRAIAFFNTNKADMARDSVKRALALNPNHSAAIQLQALVSKKGKDRDDEVVSLSELIRVKPTAQAHVDRAKLYEKAGDLIAALEDYSEAVRLEPKEQTIIARAETLTKLGEFDKAIAAYTEMLRRSPNTPTYMIGRGKAYMLKGDDARANVDFTLAKRFNAAYAHIVWQVQAGASTLKRQIAEGKANAVALAESRKAAPAAQPAQAVAAAATPAAPVVRGSELAPIIEEPAANRTLVLTRKGQQVPAAPAGAAPAASAPVQQAAATTTQETPAPAPKPVETTPVQVAATPAQKAPEPAPKPAETAPVQVAVTPAPTPAAPPAQVAEVKPVPPAPVEIAKATPPPTPAAPPPAASVTADMEAVRRHIEEASQHVRAKQPDQAIAAYSAALALKADLPATWVDRARLHLQAGRFDNAIADFGESLKHKPDQADVWLMRCSANLEAKNPKAAVPDCAKAVELNPKSAEALFTRARAYASTRQFVAAAQDYETTIEKKPEFPEAHMALGQIYIELEQYVLALRHFTIAVQQKPGFKEAYKFRAIVKETLGDKLGRDEDMSKAGA